MCMHVLPTEHDLLLNSTAVPIDPNSKHALVTMHPHDSSFPFVCQNGPANDLQAPRRSIQFEPEAIPHVLL